LRLSVVLRVLVPAVSLWWGASTDGDSLPLEWQWVVACVSHASLWVGIDHGGVRTALSGDHIGWVEWSAAVEVALDPPEVAPPNRISPARDYKLDDVEHNHEPEANC